MWPNETNCPASIYERRFFYDSLQTQVDLGLWIQPGPLFPLSVIRNFTKFYSYSTYVHDRLRNLYKKGTPIANSIENPDEIGSS